MILFRLLSWPYVRKHAFRSALTIAGIAIGVAVFVAMNAANEAVFGTFQHTVRRIAGATQLQITSGAAGFDEEVLERVQSVPEVAVAAPIIAAVAATGFAGQGNLLILGVDMTGDRSLREYDLGSGDAAVIDDPLVFLAQPDSLMVSATFAGRNGLSAGSRVPLETVDGRKDFVVRGVLRDAGLSSAFGGSIAVMDIYAAQHVFGRGRKFDRIDVALAKDVTVQAATEALRSHLGPGFQVQTPASRGQSFESVLRIYRLVLRFSSGAALVIGMFIIYNTFAVAVTQRRKEIGILRALGATRRQIAALFVGESVIGGVVGSAIGAALGYTVAGIVAGRAAALLTGVFGVEQGDIQVEGDAWLVALSLATGTAASVVAALLPALIAATVDPVRALQKGRTQVLSAGISRGRGIGALLAAVAGALLISGTSTLVLFYAGYASLLISALLLTPACSLALVGALRPLAQRIRPVEGALAIDSLMSAPRRTSATVAAVMLAIALAVGLGGAARAMYKDLSDYSTHAITADFYVTASPVLVGREYRFPDSMTAELARIDGIAQVQRVRQARIDYAGTLLMIIATDVAEVAATGRRIVVQGDSEEMYRLAAHGEGVIGSQNFATLNHLRLGDAVELMAPTGLVRLPLVGIVREYADQQGSVMVDLSVYRKHWNDDTVDLFRVYLAPGANAISVREAILRRFSGNRRVFVLSTADVRAYIEGVAGQWFGMTRTQIVVAILVAVLGIINALTITVADRRRELAVLRALGGLRAQVRAAVWLEALCIAVIGVVLGLALGAVHLYCLLEIGYRDYPGLQLDYMYPYGVALLLFPAILGAALVAALVPAEAGLRGSLVEALEYE
jgi:putative ABC transport system permease protein